MKFSNAESVILIKILQNNNVDAQKEITYHILLDKLLKGEYIKGRLLNFLLLEINSPKEDVDGSSSIEFKEIIKKIKFKATPR